MPGPRSCSVTVQQQYRAASRGLRSAHHRQTFDYLDYSTEDMEIALVIPRCLYSMFANCYSGSYIYLFLMHLGKN